MPKYLLFLFAAFFFSPNIEAQQQPALKESEVIFFDKSESVSVFEHLTEVTKVCGDTVLYPYAKRTSNRGIFVNDTTSAQGLGQWFDAPQPIKIHGFEFFSYQSQTGNSTPVIVNCNVYRAGSNFTPTGSPLASVSVLVPTSPTTSLNVIRKSAVFANPVTVNFPYILTVETTSPLNITLNTNNWDAFDGRGEYLACGKFSNNWFRGDNITVGSVDFDADVYLHPYVTFDMNVDFSTTTHCIDGDDTLQFTNLSSPVFESRFYNQKAFQDTGSSGHLSYSWNFGDGSPIEHVFNTQHVFNAKQKYVITLTDTLFGWGGECVGVKKDSIDQQPNADFAYTGFYNDIQFFNTSEGTDKWLWKFENDLYTYLETPWFHFNNTGMHDVTLIIQNACGIDSVTKQIPVYTVGVDDALIPILRIYPNPATDFLNVELNGSLSAPADINLFDLIGNNILARKVALNQQKNLQLNLKEIPDGVYFLKITSDDFSKTVKLVVSR